MMEERGDYIEESGTFKILKKSPLHIQLSPEESPTTDEKFIRESVMKTMMYGIYRSFIHTDQKEITITVIPKEGISGGKEQKYMNKYKTTLTITRASALSVIRKFHPIGSLEELVTTKKAAGITLNDEWSDEFNQCYWSDGKKPGLHAFYSELVKSAELK
jgi:hypothetical protein